MRSYPAWICGSVAALVLMLCCGLSVQAAAGVPVDAGMGTPEVQALRGAYRTLAVADHDYQGHRVRAMHAIERACDLLGTDIRDHGKGHEPQTVSDDQLKQAQQTIEQVKNGLAISQPRVAKHLDVAIEQITLALKVR